MLPADPGECRPVDPPSSPSPASPSPAPAPILPSPIGDDEATFSPPPNASDPRWIDPPPPLSMGEGLLLLLLLLLFQRINPSVNAEYKTRSADRNTNRDTFSRGMTPPPLPFCCRRWGEPRPPFADKENTMIWCVCEREMFDRNSLSPSLSLTPPMYNQRVRSQGSRARVHRSAGCPEGLAHSPLLQAARAVIPSLLPTPSVYRHVGGQWGGSQNAYVIPSSANHGAPSSIISLLRVLWADTADTQDGTKQGTHGTEAIPPETGAQGGASVQSRLLYLAVAGGSYPESACFAHAQHAHTGNNKQHPLLFNF